jgi:hypothetical protein
LYYVMRFLKKPNEEEIPETKLSEEIGILLPREYDQGVLGIQVYLANMQYRQTLLRREREEAYDLSRDIDIYDLRLLDNDISKLLLFEEIRRVNGIKEELPQLRSADDFRKLMEQNHQKSLLVETEAPGGAIAYGTRYKHPADFVTGSFSFYENV